MTKKKRIIEDIFKFTSARYISQGIGFFTAIALRAFLGPFYMGIWSLFKVGIGYSAYLFFGVDQGIANRIPFYAGQGDTRSEEEARNAGFGFMLLVSVLTGLGLLSAALILRNKFPIEVIVGLCALSVYLALSNVCIFYQILLRTRHNFSVLSKSIIFEAVINLVLVILLVRNFKIYGLYAALILVTLLNTVFIHALAKYNFVFRLKFRRILSLVKVGLPITIIGFLQWGLNSLDTIMIAKMIGVTFVGYYSIPIMARSYIGQLSGFGTVLYPRILEDYGAKQRIEDIKKYTIVPLAINAYLLPVILGLMFFAAAFIVRIVLPKFIPGILAMQILLIGMFFRSCSYQAEHFLIALNKQTRLIPVFLGALVLNAVMNYILIKRGFGIYGVACATSFVTFLNFIVLQSYAMRHFSRTREIASFFVKIIVPFVYTAAIVLFLQKFLVISNEYIEVTVKSCLLVIFSLPLFFYINKSTRVLNLILDMLITKFNRTGVKDFSDKKDINSDLGEHVKSDKIKDRIKVL